MRPRASTVAPAQRSKLTPTFASVPLGSKVDTVKMVRKKQVDDSFYLHVNLIELKLFKSFFFNIWKFQRKVWEGIHRD